MIIVFTYKRPQMLLRLLKELEGNDVMVFDDGSSYDPTEHVGYCDYFRLKHRGKEGFWITWNIALEHCRQSGHDHFMFMPDDWYGFDIERMKWIDYQMDGMYSFNWANKGMDTCWTPIQSQMTDVGGFECYRTGFVDCAFGTNRQTLEHINFRLDPIDSNRFNSDLISSGVGQQLSNRFLMNVPMYKPIHSLCKEDPHESLMNPKERKRNPRPML